MLKQEAAISRARLDRYVKLENEQKELCLLLQQLNDRNGRFSPFVSVTFGDDRDLNKARLTMYSSRFMDALSDIVSVEIVKLEEEMEVI